MNKSNITIKGINKNTTLIDGNLAGNVVNISANNVTINGFTIRNAGQDGIYVNNADDIEISELIVHNNHNSNGITLDDCTNFKILKSEIYYNKNGIVIGSTTNGLIDNSSIYNNDNTGVLMQYSSSNIQLIESIVEDNGIGLKIDWDTHDNLVRNCEFIYNNDKAIYLTSKAYNNQIYYNNLYGIYPIAKSYEIYKSNQWDDGSLGNYWSCYDKPHEDAYDTNSDGIADSPYKIPDAFEVDNYPVVHPFGSIINLDTDEIFLTIQDAIDDAGTLPGHTIYVKNDIYYENITISKDEITLLGENKDHTIIDGSYGNNSGILIQNHDNIHIEGFTIRKAPLLDDYLSNGIHILSYDLASGSKHANNNTIKDCIIYNNGKYGILIRAVNADRSVNNNIISNCEIFYNGYSGISIQTYTSGNEISFSNNNQIINCEFYYNGEDGYDEGAETAGISILSQGVITDTLIKECNFYDPDEYNLYMTSIGTGSLTNTKICNNNFIAESESVYDTGSSIWYNSTTNKGNYYSCFDEQSEGAYDQFTGPNQDIPDEDGDGIVDLGPPLGGLNPYNIPPSKDNQDLYPLATPIGMSLPVAGSNGPYNAYVDASISFDGSSSYHPDGLNMIYTWDLGNGETSYGKTITYTYTTAGEYTITLTVEDTYGLTNTATTTATITEEIEEPEEPEEPENQPPVANAGGSYYEFAGVPILFDGSDSYDIDGTSISYAWNFGDENTGSQQTPTHTYQEEGNYTVTLTVTDEDGATNSDTTTAIITLKPNNPPEQPIVNGTKTGNINISYNFTVNASDPDNDTIQYIINWDDGTNETNSSLMNSSLQFNTSHNWTKGGVYIITVYVKDKHNATSDTQQFKVIIDAHYCGSLGYLVDKNGDGEYDVFYRETTNRETPIEKNGDEYNIDINNDGEMDYIYNFTTNQVRNYPNPTDEKIDEFTIETKWIILFVFIFAAVILGIAKYAIYRSKTPKKKPKKKLKKISKKKLDKKVKKSKKKKTKKKTKKPKSKKKKMKKAEKEIDKFLSKNESKKKK